MRHIPREIPGRSPAEKKDKKGLTDAACVLLSTYQSASTRSVGSAFCRWNFPAATELALGGGTVLRCDQDVMNDGWGWFWDSAWPQRRMPPQKSGSTVIITLRAISQQNIARGRGIISPVRAQMSFFANALDRFMKERDWSQTELASRSGISQSLISRKLKGEGLEGEVLLSLVKPFGDDTGDLVAAWLLDITPESLRPLVSIRSAKPKSPAVREKPSENLLERLPPRAREAITDLIETCISRPEMVPAVRSLLALSRPQS